MNMTSFLAQLEAKKEKARRDKERLGYDAQAADKAARTQVKNLERHIESQIAGIEEDNKREALAKTAEEKAAATAYNGIEAKAAGLRPELVSRVRSATADGMVTPREVSQIIVALISALQGVRDEAVAAKRGLTSLALKIGGAVARITRLESTVTELASAASFLGSKLVSAGVLTSGSKKQDFCNGAFFWKGHRFDLASILVSLVVMKSARLYAVDNSRGLIDTFLHPTKPIAPVSKAVVYRAGDKLPENFVCFFPAGGGDILVPSGGDDVAPSDGVALVGQSLSLGLNPGSVLKTGAAMFSLTFDQWYARLLPLITESLGNMTGLGDGTDFSVFFRE